MKSIRRTFALLFVLSLYAQGQPPLRLKSGAVRENSGKRRSVGTHFIVQFGSEPGPAEFEELERRGLRVLQYVPDSALMVAAPAAPDLHGLDVLSVTTMSVSDKISPVLAEQDFGALLVVFHADIGPGKGRAAIRDLGFEVLENPSVLPSQLVLLGPHGGIAGLAARDEVAYILPASPDLTAGTPVAGCVGAATQLAPVGEYVLMGAGWPKDSSGKVALQYFIRSLTDKLSASTARSEIERALREWARYANFTLTIAGGQGGNRTIDIQFARGIHGDAYHFDGAGGALAHTFYPAPPNPEPIAGDMHLDSDEPWSAGANVDLYSVALHETGHALGLGHSDRPGAVMYPYYRLSTGLTDDDIAAIRSLYGAIVPATSVPPSPPAPPVPPAPPTAPPKPPATTPDTTAPSLQVDSPAFSITTTTAASIAISGKASDNVAVTAVKWSNSTGGSGTASGTAAWSAVVPLLTGTNTLTVRAYDAAGNSGWRAITVVRR